ncbi:MAG TPA: hypothetical protein VGD40_02755 [Chryseosolibacter sp.]
MACTTGSVKEAADKSVKAKEQIDKLLVAIRAQESDFKGKFFDQISKSLTAANITDAREIGYNKEVKTEFSSEFSLDKVAAVVTAVLKAAIEINKPGVAPAMSKEAIEAYVDVVNAVAEAAKSRSAAASNLSYSMNRLSPGIFAFLYATSSNITDEDTFGSEAVTTTAIFYRLMQSIDDVKSEVEFSLAQIEGDNLLNMKTVQAALTDELANGKITIDEWMKKDEAYELAVKRIQARLDSRKLGTRGALPTIINLQARSSENQRIVSSAIKLLSRHNDRYKAVIETLQKRLADSYF